MAADLAGRGHEDGGLAGDDLEVFRLGELEVARVEELEDFAFGHHGGGVGQDLQDLQMIGGHRQGQGLGQEKVPHQDHGMVAPDGVGRGGAPAHLGGVDDVVVQQGGGVQVLEDGGEIRQVVALAAAHAGGQDEQQRPDALAAAQQDVPPHFGDERHVGLEVGRQGHIDGGDVRLQILEQLFGGFNHQIKITYIPGEVNSLEALPARPASRHLSTVRQPGWAALREFLLYPLKEGMIKQITMTSLTPAPLFTLPPQSPPPGRRAGPG